jgi:CDGSH-type Zn-finger protein
MSEPVVAAKVAARVELEAEKAYFWCTCGKSEKQPFCDGAHKGSDFAPLRFKAEKTGSAALCQCKATGKGPFCDGTHNKL